MSRSAWAGGDPDVAGSRAAPARASPEAWQPFQESVPYSYLQVDLSFLNFLPKVTQKISPLPQTKAFLDNFISRVAR
jgi:hypothetical protein